ncbi:hypothetical protein AB0B78_26960 [Streptomyces sp. NPDC040724]|uniref:hypothetical protein n=1 Tax=Streptomyces sp. NPDC040724 TaxID=3155612 RepID=UPI0033CC63D2
MTARTPGPEAPASEAPGPYALCRGLVVIGSGSGLVIEGGPYRILLGGDSATTLLPGLLRLLADRLTFEEMCARLPVEPDEIRQALSLLDDWGLLERPPTGPSRAHGAHDDSAVFHSRLISTTGGHRSADTLLDALHEAVVLVVAPEHFGRPLSEDLVGAGIGTVRVVDGSRGLTGPSAAEVLAADCTLVVALDEAGRPEEFDAVVRAAHAVGVPLLRTAFTGGAVEAGPLFHPAETACVSCFRLGHRGAGAAAEPGAEAVPDSRAQHEDSGLLAGLAAMEALAIVAGTTRPETLNRVVRTSVSDHTTERYVCTPDEDCPECAAAHGAPARGRSDMARLIEAYEGQHAMPPEGMRAVPRTLAPEQRRLSRLLTQRPDFPTSPSRTLPSGLGRAAPAGDRPPVTTAGAGDRHEVLAALLRATASAGVASTYGQDPGSVELYLLGEPSLCGLPGSVFTYDPARHRVLSVRADAVRWRAPLAAAGLNGTECEAAVVIVADVGRLHAAYGDSAWRLGHLNGGFAAMRLAAAAASHRIRISFSSAWGDDLAELLELDPERETVAALAGLAGLPGEERTWR